MLFSIGKGPSRNLAMSHGAQLPQHSHLEHSAASSRGNGFMYGTFASAILGTACAIRYMVRELSTLSWDENVNKQGLVLF